MNLSEALKAYMEECGLPFHGDSLSIDGEIHRYSSRNNNKKSEWYIVSEIEPNKFICTFSSWREEKKITWRSYDKNSIPDEKFKLELIEDQIIKEETVIEKEQIKVANECYSNADLCLSHPYLIKKNIKTHNLKQISDQLVIPMYNVENKITSLQFINTNGKKRFKAGISTKNLFHLLGDFSNKKEYIVCEGFATGASIYENTNIPIVVTFSANNCLLIGKAFQNLYPEKEGSLAVDNDKKGLEILEKWKKFINENHYLPTKEGMDFNDLYNDMDKIEVNKIFFPKHLKGKTIAEIINEKIPEEKWYNSLISEGTFNIIYGCGGVGKSRIAYEMGFCLSSNEQFLYIKPQGHFKTLYIDGEMTGFEIQSRVKDIFERHPDADFEEENFKIIKSDDFIKEFDTDMNLFNDKHRKYLEKAIEEADVIFFDNYGTLTMSPGGEGYKLDRVEWEKLFNWIKKFREKGKAIIFLMHATKNGKLEGVGKIRNDADLVLEIRKPDNPDNTTLLHFEIHFEKARKIPIYKQIPIGAKIIKDTKKFFGWTGYKI